MAIERAAIRTANGSDVCAEDRGEYPLMANRPAVRETLKAGLLAVVVGLFGFGLCGATASNAALTPPFPAVMSGLDNPRGLAFGPEGALYVAEAGRGGTQPCFTLRGQHFSAGPTGAVSRLWHGVQTRVATGLPSFSQAGETAAQGPHDIAFQGRGNARVSIGSGGNAALRATECAPLGANLGWLARLPASGDWRPVVDLAAYEASANPDGGLIEGNPYGLLAKPGATLVTDAGGNSLLRVAASGDISTVAVFPARAQGRSTDSVPTSIAVGPDGAYYVGELTGAPFAPGLANVYRVVPGQAPTVFRSGFLGVIDIAFGADGSLYVLEFATGAGLTGPGDLVRVGPNGARSVVATGFMAPTSVAIGPRGALYVSNCGIFPASGPYPCHGEVVRIEP
jgi:hypothetical protein